MGKARDLKKRVSSYFARPALDTKTSKLVAEIASIDHVIVASEIEAFLLEANLIKKYKPYYNIRYTDDKSYPFLEINKKPIPFVLLTRKKGNKNAEYLGPYTSVTDLKIVLRLLRRIFPYQSGKNHPKQRCLYNHIGLCLCIPVFPERLAEGKHNIKNLVSFLKGNKDRVVRELKNDQKEYVRREEFEKAGEIQRKIEKIGIITSQNFDPFKYQERPDYYFDRINNEVQSLKETLAKYGLDVNNLERIECYDISNIQGKNATGSMVVFINGDWDKKEYRKFRIKFKKTPDDFDMMREIIKRRLKNDWKVPDLMVIDGGKGQVSAVLQAFAELKASYPVIGLAKREETIIVPIRIDHIPGVSAQTTPGVDQDATSGRLEFMEIKLPKSNPGVNLLRRIRDEAHRFAITYHRLLRKKALNLS